MDMEELTRFVERLKKQGIDIKLSTNFPWIYMDSINGKHITEKRMSEYGYTLAFYPIKNNQKRINFLELGDTMDIIRKYAYGIKGRR